MLAPAGVVLPPAIFIVGLRERPFFPIQVMPITLPEEPWRAVLERVGNEDGWVIGLLMVRPGAPDPPAPEHFHNVGCAVRIHQPQLREGKVQFVAEAIRRFSVRRWIGDGHPARAQVDYLDAEAEDASREVKAHAMAIIGVLKELIPLNPLYNEEMKLYLERFNPNQPAFLTWFAANLTSAKGEDLQRLMEIPSLLERMARVLEMVRRELDVARLQARIRGEVEGRMGEQQRKFFLREQLKIIQKELGIAKDDRSADAERFRARLEERHPSEEAAKRIEEELDKFSVLETGSPEYAVTRNYLDWITDLPWGLFSEDHLDLDHARKVLDADHSGLEDVKERIVEFLAVGRLRGEVAGAIILLVGPPGSGKTSIGRSIANALGRRFYRFSVGGMRDEAEIKGHRRTYIGALPGKFVQALRDAQTANPVLLLDEVDKIGASYQGDPASALLEALDPEQNTDFLDHYLDVRLDLSHVLFVCTANQIDSIPPPLLDRMEVIRLSGYITSEKVTIAREHLWPRQRERAGFKPGQLRISNAALRAIAEDYAREAGVRGLDKQLSRIVRKAAVRIARETPHPIRVNVDNLHEFLGRPLYRREREIDGVGVVRGLAWTALGGVTLAVEAVVVHHARRGMKLTGRLGDVMRESAEIALSFISAHLGRYGAPEGFFDDALVHLHVPEGATPKDGPSAGITIASALLSLARGERVPARLAMTGELTLTGQVLPVGGIREKVVAARRNRIARLILPEANHADFDELPALLHSGLEVHFAKHFTDVYAALFPAANPARRR